jgi:hypothetical protein
MKGKLMLYTTATKKTQEHFCEWEAIFRKGETIQSSPVSTIPKRPLSRTSVAEYGDIFVLIRI